MKNKVIKKGRHYCTPFPFPCFKFYKKDHLITINKKIKFEEDCKYDIDTDQSDINKAFGISYGFHQTQSDRIGWRYNKKENKIELLLYSYVLNSKVQKKSLMFIDFNKIYDIEMKINLLHNTRTISIVINNHSIFCEKFIHKYCFWGYTLGLYFGGNRVAPHNMHISL